MNRDRVDTTGLEAVAQYAVTDVLTVSGHATRLEIEPLDPSVQLRQRPEVTAGAGLEWMPREDWTVFAALNYVGSRVDSSVPTGDQVLPSHQTIDVSVNYRVRAGIELRFSVDNLNDEAYEAAIGFPDLGRRLRASVNGAF